MAHPPQPATEQIQATSRNTVLRPQDSVQMHHGHAEDAGTRLHLWESVLYCTGDHVKRSGQRPLLQEKI